MLDVLKHFAGRNGTADRASEFRELAIQLANNGELLQERIAELEFALEDVGWRQVDGDADGREFSREALKRIAALARLMFLKNPLINRAVTLQAAYVWGQGATIGAKHPDVDAVIQAFLDDPKNRAELTGHQARTLKEQELQVEGNLFFALFTDKQTGRVVVRTIPAREVSDILTDPEDAKAVRYYRRCWMVQVGAEGLNPRTESAEAYYPALGYSPRVRPTTVRGKPVEWDVPVYHLKVGGLGDMRFGVPEVYQALDWALAYKSFLEDVATLMRAYSRFAHKVSTKGGSKAVQGVKNKLGTTLTPSQNETNPAPVAGSTAIVGDNLDIAPMQLRGASVDPEDGRRLLLMVCAATGLPETFFGDVSVGTLATAKSLDRPTELKIKDRQTLWLEAHRDILNYVIDAAALAPGGKLGGSLKTDDYGQSVVVLANDKDTGEPIDRALDLGFPSILEHDPEQTIAGIVNAATLDGKAPAGTIDPKTLSRLLYTALGEDDIDELLDQLYPEEPQTDADPAAESDLQAAARAFRETLDRLAEQAHSEAEGELKGVAESIREALVELKAAAERKPGRIRKEVVRDEHGQISDVIEHHEEGE